MRKSEPGNSIYLEIGVWYDEAKDSIHIASNDVVDFHTTVRADAKLKRGHPNLFRKLAKILRDNGAPAPQDEPSDA
ncbi:MAG: hypothetical protein OXC10_07240 [Rhodospirillaceae bacterium]|nr:hypothetical protein [Rhodospirillaceae bacterium]